MNRLRTKVKKKLNKEKSNISIKKDDKILLFIKKFINDKLNNFYIKAFIIKNVKGVIALLKLLDTKIFSRFHTSMLKKALSSIFLIST